MGKRQLQPGVTLLQGAGKCMPTAVGGAMAHRRGMAAISSQDPGALEPVITRSRKLAPKVEVLPATLNGWYPPTVSQALRRIRAIASTTFPAKTAHAAKWLN